MRLLLVLALGLLVFPACDTTTPGEEEPPTQEFIGVRVLYTVSFTGDAASATVRYTNADGEEVTDTADFARQTEYTLEFDLPPESAGTFSLFAEGFVVDGSLSTTILVTRLDNDAEVTSDAQVSSVTSGSQEVSARATVDIEPEPLASSI